MKCLLSRASVLVVAMGISALGLADHVPGRLLVGFAPNTPAAKAQQALDAVGARLERDMPELGVKVVQLPENANEQASLRSLANRPNVEFVEFDEIREPQSLTPTDPWFANQWHLVKINAPAAWDVTQGSSSVVIAILDSGVEGTHPDLSALLVSGWNVYNNNGNTADVNGHGTAVAGCAVASSNNGIGVAGVAWNCRLMPIRISDTTGYATFSAMASGLTWAADHGARVANLSYIASDSATVKSAAQYFTNKGGVVTSSAGNGGTQLSSPDNPYILTVSNTDLNDVIHSTSNYGNCIDVAAPGLLIYTTTINASYGAVSGTSVSSPLVAGVAALVMSANPQLTPAQVQQVIKDSADDKGSPGWDMYYGWGRINAGRAVAMARGTTSTGGGDQQAPSVSISQPTGGLTLQGTFTISAQAFDNVGVASVTLFVDGVQVASTSSSSCSFAWQTANAGNGAHVVKAVATDTSGNTSNTQVNVDVMNPSDVTPPTISILSPTGGTVSNLVRVSVDATDDTGVVKVELYVDGKLSTTSTSAPFSLTWNSKKAKAGAHTLQCRAYDAAGNASWSQLVTVTK